MKKKLMALLCAAAMTVSLAACGAGTDTTYAGQTLTGRVTAMDGTAVTLALGELSEDAAPADGASSDNDSQQPPEMPSGDSGSSQPDQQRHHQLQRLHHHPGGRHRAAVRPTAPRWRPRDRNLPPPARPASGRRAPGR